MVITDQDSAANLSKRRSQIFVVITTFCSLLAIVGFALYGLPFFYDFYMKEFGWSRTLITSGNFFGKLLVAPLFGFLAGWIIDRYGPRRMMMAGALMTGAALIGLSTMSSLSVFYISYIFVALGYVFGGPLPCQVLISRSFSKNRGKAMGIAYLGIGSGFALVPLIAAGLEKHFGWHISLGSLGIMIIIIALPLAYFIRDPKPDPVADEGSKETTSVRNILKSPYFYLLALGSMCSIAAVGGVNQHFKLYLRELDYTQIQAARMISLVAVMSLAGRVIMGWLADIFQRKYIMILIYILVGVSIPLLIMPDFPGKLYVFAVIFGIGLGGDYMIIPLIAGDLFGIKTLGRVMGIILVADGIAEATMPVAVSALREAAQDYSMAFIVLIGVAFTGALIISFLPKLRKKIKAD